MVVQKLRHSSYASEQACARLMGGPIDATTVGGTFPFCCIRSVTSLRIS